MVDVTDDRALALAYARGRDRNALERLVERRWPDAVRFAERALGDPMAAEDAAQEAFVRLVDGLGRYDAERPFEPWFRSVVANAVRDAARSGSSRRRREQAVARARPQAAGPEGERLVEAAEMAEHVRRLPADIRVAVILHYYQGLGHEEVAEAVGCPVGTASSRLRRGLEKLRASLAAAGRREATAASVAAMLTLAAATEGAAATEATAAEAVATGAAGGAGGGAPAWPAPGSEPSVAALETAVTERARSLALRAIVAKVAAAVVVTATLGGVVALWAGAGDPDNAGAGPALLAAGYTPGGGKDGHVAPDKWAQALKGAPGAGPGAVEGGGPGGRATTEPPAPIALAPSTPRTSPAASPTEPAAARAEDPLVARMKALREQALGVWRNLSDELDERCPEGGGGAGWPLGSRAIAAVIDLRARVEEVPADPAGRAEQERREAERAAASALEIVHGMQQGFRFPAREQAGARPSRFARSIEELCAASGYKPPDAPDHEVRIVEAGPDGYIAEAAPRSDRAGARWLSCDQEYIVRVDIGRPTAASPRWQDAGNVPGAPSRHEGEIRDLEHAADLLAHDLHRACDVLLEQARSELPAYLSALRIDLPKSGALGDIESRFLLYETLKRSAKEGAEALLDEIKGANEAGAIGALRTLTTAQALFREGDKDRDDVLDYAAHLRDLGACRLIDAVLAASGEKEGYRFEVLAADQFTWSATADPVEPGKTGDRWFFVDESGVIRFSTTATATAESFAIGG